MTTNTKTYGAASGDGTITSHGMTREQATRRAQEIANKTGEAAEVFAEPAQEGDAAVAVVAPEDRYYITIKTAPHQQWSQPSGWTWSNLDDAKRGARKADELWMAVRLWDEQTGEQVDYK